MVLVRAWLSRLLPVVFVSSAFAGSLSACDADSVGARAPSHSAGGAGSTTVVWPPAIDPAAFGHADLSTITVAAFSQTGTNQSDPQVLDLVPDIVPRAWAQWDIYGLQPSDYGFAYPKSCEAEGTTFVGGMTASVIFEDEMSSTELADEVGRDATGQPVPHSEIVPGAYRGALASPGFRQRLIDIAKIQIDGGVNGLFFDEVNSSYIGAGYDGDEGFDDHDVADFGRFLCRKHGGDPAALAAFDLAPADGLDCAASDPGSGFDYRGYLARHNAGTAPLGNANPLAAEWGTTVQNRPDPAIGTFVEAYPTLVYWQEIVATVRKYARDTYGKEILVTANGVFPFVDFQAIGVYDWNIDGTGPRGFDYVPTTGDAPNLHLDGTASFMPALATLKARSKRVVESVGGTEVPLLLFLDWPTDSMSRYYALPMSERQDYVRIFLAEAYAYGAWLSLPLATTTDTNTATALGMMDVFKQLRVFYRAHADLFRSGHDSDAAATVSTAGVASHLVTLDDGRTVLHLVNHNYDAAFIPQANATATIPASKAPSSVTLASPDLPNDVAATFTYASGELTVDLGTLTSSLVVVVQ